MGAATGGPADDMWLTGAGTDVERFTCAEIVDPEGNRIGLMHR
jgi:hypothetical protein